MTTHTPGPWKTTSDGWIYPADYVKRACPNKYESAVAHAYGVSDTAMANSRLIAAAPELLSAAVAVLPILAKLRPDGHIFHDLRAAIAKAEGKET